MRVVVISDTHNQLSQVKLPDGDLLIHAGDATGRGLTPEVAKLGSQFTKLVSKYSSGILFVPGNHDSLFEISPSLAQVMMPQGVTVLHERQIVIKGIKFYGSALQPAFCDWSFNRPRNRTELFECWERIPDDTDILITHTPPYGILDKDPNNAPVGCELLRKRTDNLTMLKVHCFGHLHESYGVEYNKELDRYYINASICNDNYKTVNKPVVFDINDDKIISFVED